MSRDQFNSKMLEGLQMQASASKTRFFLEGELIEKCVGNIDIPADLSQDLKDNPQYTQEYYSAIAKSVWGSLSDPVTAPKGMLTENMISERLEICKGLIVAMRKEAKRPLIECFRALGTMLASAIIARRHRDDIVGDRLDKSMAALDGCGITDVDRGQAPDLSDGQEPTDLSRHIAAARESG